MYENSFFINNFIDYLNASTNFLDKNIAPHIVTIFADYLENVIKPDIPTTVFEKHKSILCVGMEVAGGVYY